MSHDASAKVRTKSYCSRVKATEIIDEFKGLSIVPIPMVRTSSHGFGCVFDKTYHLACHISQDLVIFNQMMVGTYRNPHASCRLPPFRKRVCYDEGTMLKKGLIRHGCTYFIFRY